MLRRKGREQVSLDVMRRGYSDGKRVRSHQRVGNSSGARIRLLEPEVPGWTSGTQRDAEGVSTSCGLRSGAVINERSSFVRSFSKTPANRREDSIISR